MVRCLLSGLLLFFVPAAPALGQILVWDANGAGPPDGTFGVAANWNPDQVPTASNAALFLIDDTYTVTFDANATSNDLVILDGDLSFLSDSTTVRAYDLSDLLVQGGTLQVGSESAPIEMNVAGGLDIGGSLGDGEVVVSGSDSRLNTNGGTNNIGDFGHSGTLIYEMDAFGVITGTTNVGVSSHDASEGTFEVYSTNKLTTESLNVGTVDSLATGTVTLDGARLTQMGASTLTLGSDSGGTGTLELQNGGVFETGTGDITINATGEIVAGVTGSGSFRAHGNVYVDGGTITVGDSGDFLLDTGLNLTATNSAQITSAEDIEIGGGATFSINSGADLLIAEDLEVGFESGDNVIIVDGADTTLTALSALVGITDAATGSIVVRNGADATLQFVSIAAGDADNVVGSLHVESGATVTVNSCFYFGFESGVGSSAVLTVDGVGSMLTLGDLCLTSVGERSQGSATINIQNGGVFDAGVSRIDVGAAGVINAGVIGGGVLNIGGKLDVYGGTVNGAISLSAPNGDFEARSDSQIHLTSDFAIQGYSEVSIESGSDLMLEGNLNIGTNGTQNFLWVRGMDTTFTQIGPVDLTIGYATTEITGISFLIVEDDAVFTSGTGTITVNKTGIIDMMHNGTFYANGDVIVDAGTMTGSLFGELSLPPGDTLAGFVLGPGRTFSSSNNAQIYFQTMRMNDGTTVEIHSGSILAANHLGIADGTLIVDGAGSHVLNDSEADTSNWGDEAPAHVTIRNYAVGRFAEILMAVGGIATTSTFDVESGATVTTRDLAVANFLGVPVPTVGIITIDGDGSSLSQKVDSTLTLGNDLAGGATLNVTNGGTFSSGTGDVALHSTGAINIDGGTVNLNGPLVVADGTINFLNGTFNMTGDLTVGPGGLLGENLTLLSNRVLGVSGTTTVAAGHTLTVEDTSFTTGDLAVNGTLAATGADVIGTVTNNAAGQINVTAGIATIFGATFFGDVINDGTFDISAGALAVFLGSFGGNNGITGAGTAQFDNELSPGNSTAAISFGGDLTFGAEAVFSVEINGTTPGDEFDQVNVAGTATLDGTLEIFLGEYLPMPCDSFPIMTFAARNGEFETVDGDGLLGDVFLLVEYGDTDVSLLSVLTGDANLSGEVDIADFTLWADGFQSGTKFTEGDFTGDGEVDIADFTLWADNFGNTAGGFTPAATTVDAVPEPSTFALLVVGVLAIGFYSRRRREK